MENKKRIAILIAVFVVSLAAAFAIGFLLNNTSEAEPPEPPEPRVIGVSVTQQRNLVNFRQFLQTDNLRTIGNNYFDMYIGEWGTVFLVCRANGDVFASNPIFLNFPSVHEHAQLFPNEFGFNEALRSLYSQIALNYYYEGRLLTLSTFPDSVSPRRIRHFRFEESTVTRGDGQTQRENPALTVNFTLAENLDHSLMFAMTAETFYYYYEKLRGFQQAGYIGESAAALFRDSHTPVDWALLASSGRWDYLHYLELYPAFPELGMLYLLKPLANIALNDMINLYCLLGIDTERINEELRLLGNEGSAIQSPLFRVPIVYELNGRELLVWLDTENLHIDEGFTPERIYLRGDFGAETNQVLYFPPDGSTTIRFTFP